MTDDMIKQMVNRFLSWKLPEDFNPDNGISAERPNYGPNFLWEPMGTNLLNYAQAEAMVRHMLDVPAKTEDGLSFDAKIIAGAWFGLMTPEKGKLTFALSEHRPTDRALDALAELVRAGLVSVEPLNRYGGLIYRPLAKFREEFRQLVQNESNPDIKWPLTQPIVGGGKAARAIQKRALAATQPDQP